MSGSPGRVPATPGQGVSPQAQAAYDAFWASRALGGEPSSPLEREPLSVQKAWEAAVQAAIKASIVPALVANGRRDSLTGRIAEERDAYRGIVAEILARLEEALRWSGSEDDDAQIAGWSERAGLGRVSGLRTAATEGSAGDGGGQDGTA